MSDHEQPMSGDDSSTVPALNVAHLEAGYGQSTILRDVSLTVPAGAVVALLGPNGAGKSTLLRTVSGLLRPTKGKVELLGQDVTKLPPYRRSARGMCYIPEGRAIFRRLTVRENIIMHAAKGRQDEALTLLAEAFPRLSGRLSQQAGTLSGGEQQMLAMARAYVREQRLILIDEASLGLAPVIVDTIFDFLSHQLVKERGMAMLLVDQFVNRALNIAQWAYVLRRGEIAYSGSSRDLLNEDLFAHYLGAESVSGPIVS
jgi:branched-chain amino acid transport system ATP-binding protein